MPSTPESDLSNLLSVSQAIALLDAVTVNPRIETIPIALASGRRLAEDLMADQDYPPFDKSLMDGYAARAADVTTPPVALEVVGEIAAGQWPHAPVGAGKAVAIMTGAPLPEGADTVVPVEQTRPAHASSVDVLTPCKSGQNIARRGSDMTAGRVVLPRGSVLGAPQIAVACTIGAGSLPVFVRPRVAVLGTGDELVTVSATPAAGQIRNSNSAMLLSLLASLGCEVTDLGVVCDDPPLIADALSRGLAYDALFVTGGMSMGRHDHVPRLLAELKVEAQISKLRIRPGKPFVFGVHAGGFVFGLPGNPVSAFVCTFRLASRLLSRLGGGQIIEPWVSGVLDQGLAANGAREFYQPAIRVIRPGGSSARSEFATITPLSLQGSADLFTLARANVLLVRGEQEPPLAKGTLVRALALPS